jgi:hypothetical protein
MRASRQLTIEQLEELRAQQTRYRPYVRVHRRPVVDGVAWILNAALVALVFAAGSLVYLPAAPPAPRVDSSSDLQPMTEKELFRP